MNYKKGGVLLSTLLFAGQASAETTITLEEVTLSGLIEVEASYHKPDSGDATGDIIVATTEIGIDAKVNELVSANITLLYEEGDTPLEIDVSTITLSPDEHNWYVTAGQQYLPFGRYETTLISDPLTLELGEIRQSALAAGIENDGLMGSLYFFNGENNDSTNIGFDLGYTQEAYGFSLSYLDNLPETYIFAANNADKKYAGFAASGQLNLGIVSLMAEYLGATQEIQSSILSYKGLAAKPETWGFEVAISFHPMGKPVTLGAAYQGSKEAAELGLPENRVMLGANVEIIEATTLGLEISSNEDYSLNNGGSGQKSHSVIAQLAVEF